MEKNRPYSKRLKMLRNLTTYSYILAKIIITKDTLIVCQILTRLVDTLLRYKRLNFQKPAHPCTHTHTHTQTHARTHASGNFILNLFSFQVHFRYPDMKISINFFYGNKAFSMRNKKSTNYIFSQRLFITLRCYYLYYAK